MKTILDPARVTFRRFPSFDFFPKILLSDRYTGLPKSMFFENILSLFLSENFNCNQESRDRQ